MICAVMLSAASAGRSRCVRPQPAAKAAAIESVVATRFMESSPFAIFCKPMLCRRSALDQRPESRFLKAGALLYVAAKAMEEAMKTMFGRLAGTLLALVLTSGFAAAQSKITVAIGGGSCLCYLPTVLAKQLGEYKKAGLAVELVDLKGGSDAL